MEIGLIEVLKKKSWNVQENSNKRNTDIESFHELPLDLKYILENYKVISDPGDMAWFYTLSEIKGDTESEFSWDELRNQSLEAAINKEQIKQINNFWDKHFLYFMSVKNGYSFLALCLSGKNKNKIVYGYEPEYEEVSVVFENFNEFYKKLEEHILEQKKEEIFDALF